MEETCFVEDIYLPQMLYAVTIRSPVAKGRLKSIECPKLPYNCILISAKDIPGTNSLEDSDIPILASEKLSYIGEPVALLMGPDRNALEDCAKNCRIIAEEEEPVFSENKAGDDADAVKREIQTGDTGTAFTEAAFVVRGTYSTCIQEHWYAEPTGAVAWTDTCPPENQQREKGKRKGKQEETLTIRTATQWPSHVKRSVAGVLGLPAASVLVYPTITGLHMDGKFWYPSFVACHAALGAWITKKPVRLILTRTEDFAFSPKRCRSEIHITSALDEKGEITGMEINAAVNLGAYGINAAEIIDQCCFGCLGIYKTRNISFTGKAYKTNIPPQGPFAGFGFAQGSFALERHIGDVADSCGLDPAQWRVDNLAKTVTFPAGLPEKDTSHVKQLINIAVKMSDYSRKQASYEMLRQNRRQIREKQLYSTPESPARIWAERGEILRGIGIAMGGQGGGLLYPGQDRGICGVELVLEVGGSLEIRAGMTGPADAWAGIARGILGVDEEKVRVSCGPFSPDSGPDTASRSITVMTKLVEQACLAIQKQRFRNPLPITVRKTTRPQKNPVFERSFPPPEGVLQDCGGFFRSGLASAVVEVDIDPVEYIPRIRGVWMSVNGGKIISEDNARRTLKISAVQALGWAYREQIHYINGILPKDQFEGFDIFELSEIPQIHIDFVPNTSEDPKGIGDLPFSCIPAAYTQAVSQAIDFYFRSVPIRSGDVWEAGKQKSKEELQV